MNGIFADDGMLSYNIGKVCKPRPVKMMWVEPGTFVADDRYPAIRSMRELRTAIRRKPAAGAGAGVGGK